jgi:hypothetical protein
MDTHNAEDTLDFSYVTSGFLVRVCVVSLYPELL